LACLTPGNYKEWTEACCDWIIDELNLNLGSSGDVARLLQNVESQLLQSDLRDSAISGTGLPPNISTMKQGRLSGKPVLVEIVAITDIGHSAFQLQTVRQTRIDRADLAGLNAERGDDGQAEEEEEGPVPRYPRSMLRLELSDGSTTLKAIEYRKVPQLQLGETPLGYKASVLGNM
jgi:RecQ-mediated genome instability protein 1